MNNQIFMILVFLLGLVLVISSAKVTSDIKKDCASDTLRNANRGILVIGVVAIVSSASFMVCHMRCGCGTTGNLDTMAYIGFILALGITLIVLGATVQSEAKGSCAGAKNQAPLIWSIGSVMSIGAFAYLGYQGYQSGMFAKLGRRKASFSF